MHVLEVSWKIILLTWLEARLVQDFMTQLIWGMMVTTCLLELNGLNQSHIHRGCHDSATEVGMVYVSPVALMICLT